MIAYNPKDWLSFLFKFHKADTFRQLLPLIAFIGLYTAMVVVIDEHIFQLNSESRATKISLMHSILGFVISMLLVFRTNTAYERWWEGRKHWGSLVNCSRNLSVKINAFISSRADRELLKNILIVLPYSIKNHLRKTSISGDSIIQENYVFAEVEESPHLPIALVKRAYGICHRMRENGSIGGEQLLILNNEIQQYLEICGACERISNTPIPYSYSVFLKKFIFFYTMTLPLALAPLLSYYAVPIIIFIFYVLASLELIAEEIENPFGTDDNDLPLDAICATIKNNVENVLD